MFNTVAVIVIRRTLSLAVLIMVMAVLAFGWVIVSSGIVGSSPAVIVGEGKAYDATIEMTVTSRVSEPAHTTVRHCGFGCTYSTLQPERYVIVGYHYEGYEERIVVDPATWNSVAEGQAYTLGSNDMNEWPTIIVASVITLFIAFQMLWVARIMWGEDPEEY